MTKANEVLNQEMLRLVGRSPVRSTVSDAKALRAKARLEEAKRLFPGFSDWEALDKLREWNEDHR